MLDFLDKDQPVKLPVGGDFAPTGFIAHWRAGVMSTFMSESVIEQENKLRADEGQDIMPLPDGLRMMGQSGWIRYYYKDYSAAESVAEALGLQYGSNQTWLFEASRDSVLNFADAEALGRFGQTISAEVRVATLRSRKYRHELHWIALPAAVAAMAKVLGYDNPGFEIPPELLSRETLFTDEFFALMCGDPDKQDYSNAILPQLRDALWKALGEPNFRAYNPIGTGTKFDTKSEKLSNCLGILAYEWKSPIWARLLLVPDPRVDAIFSGADEVVKRLTVPALVEIFSSESEAKAVAEAELAERETISASAPESRPKLPSAWDGMTSEWVEAVKEIRDKVGQDASLPIVQKAIKDEHGDTLGATAQEVMAWFPHVGDVYDDIPF